MSWLVVVEHWMVGLAAHVPLPAFLAIGEVVEEVISPIPSQAVLITAGTIAQAQRLPLVGLILLAVLAAVVKTAATTLYFLLAGVVEDKLIFRFGKYLGITQGGVEAISRRLNRSRAKEFVSLFAIRCLPILPSVPVSVMCGILKVNRRVFILATLAGNLIRGLMVLLTGYLGFDVLESFAQGALSGRTFLILGILALLVGFFGWGYWKRYKQPPELA